MKQLRFLPVALTFLLASCVKTPMEQGSVPVTEDYGMLQLGLSVDDRFQIVQTKSATLDEALVPHVDSLYVELYRYDYRKLGEDKYTTYKMWNRLYFGKYEHAKDSLFRVNAGEWRMIAFHGDSTACGFDKPYFRAQEDFTVSGGVDQEGNPNVSTVTATAKVENVWITVNFDETVPGSYYDYFVRFTNLDDTKNRQILRYQKDQTKAAFMMPAENLQIEFMAQREYGDEESWRFVNLGTVATKANDHLTVNLSIKDPRYGTLDVNIRTDENIVKETTDIEILEIWAPQDAPKLVAAGFPGGDHSVVEGDNTGNNATVSVLARGGLKNFFLKVDSDYLTPENGFDLPLGEELDLANPTAETQAKLDKLAAEGFDWQADMKGSTKLTYLTMTKLFEKINSKNTSLSVSRNLATFSIRVVDNVNKEIPLTLTSTAMPITQTLTIAEGDVWAKKIYSPMLAVERGKSSLYMLQVSSDGQSWKDLKTFERADVGGLDFGTLDVQPSTVYYFRTRYNNNDALVSNVVTVTTEAEQQVGNAGFENFWTTTLRVNVQAGNDYDREWYLPQLQNDPDPWWAVNSRKTMPSSHSITNKDYKCFPCAGYSTNHVEGEKSAMVFTVNTDWWATAGTATGDDIPGEIWIGTADNSGNHASDGHSFSSRPNAVRFHYNYVPYGSETFVFTMILKDASQKEIAKIELTDGAMSDGWEMMEIPIVYADKLSKAVSIYMSFKSCASGKVYTDQTIELAGKNQRSHIGSVLRIDNIQLIY